MKIPVFPFTSPFLKLGWDNLINQRSDICWAPHSEDKKKTGKWIVTCISNNRLFIFDDKDSWMTKTEWDDFNGNSGNTLTISWGKSRWSFIGDEAE